MEPLEEEPPEFDELEELLQPEAILWHEDKILRNGKVLRKYLIKFKNYSFDDAKWMREPQLKDSMALVHEYNAIPLKTSMYKPW